MNLLEKFLAIAISLIVIAFLFYLTIEIASAGIVLSLDQAMNVSVPEFHDLKDAQKYAWRNLGAEPVRIALRRQARVWREFLRNVPPESKDARFYAVQMDYCERGYRIMTEHKRNGACVYARSEPI